LAPALSRLCSHASVRTLAAGLTALSLLAVSGLAAAQTSIAARQAPPEATAPSAGSADPEYRISLGDQLDIKFFYNPELNEQVIVRPDGRISLQLIPEIVVNGLTPAALTRQLTEAYAKDLKQPEVTVIVRSFGSQRVYVDGEVGKPGMVPILGLMTALQAIAEAGGMKETARDYQVIVIRRGALNKPMAFPLDLKKAREGKDLSQDVTLAPFDIIYVPRSRITNINTWVDQYIRKNIPLPFGIQYGVYR
jgi:polysaccharide biosynthesis/export protein